MGDADYAAAGLLEDVRDPEEREARIRLLDALRERGYELEELRRAHAEDRLAMLPLDRVFAGGCQYTPRDVVERTGLTLDFVTRNHRALGLTIMGPDDPVFDEDDMGRFEAAKQIFDTGLPLDQWLDMTRVTGQAAARIAEAFFQQFGEAFIEPGDNRDETALRFADIAGNLMPFLGPMVEGPVRFHLREILRRESVETFERSSGVVPGARDTAVAFADLVGFTSLTESLELGEIGDVTGTLETLAADVAEAPVRLVKTIGDAAMLAAPEPAQLTAAALDLVDAVERERTLPQLRVGMACGPALQRAGDVYGRPVNLASRLTSVAPAGGAVATEQFAERAGEGFSWSAAGEAELKGIDAPVRVMRAARA